MAKVQFDPIIKGISGTLNGVVFRRFNKRQYASGLPKRSKKRPTAAMLAQRDRFRLAAQQSKAILADPENRDSYTAQARKRRLPIFAFLMSQFLKGEMRDSHV